MCKASDVVVSVIFSAAILRGTVIEAQTEEGPVNSLIPRPVEKSEKRAWYPLFAHALN